MLIDEIRARLFEMRDEEYRDFNAKLIPNVDADKVIGVRTPALRKYAKELSKREDIGEFISALPHRYFEENQLHGFIISEIKDYERCLSETERFLPYIDNWATCDQTLPKVFSKHTEELFPVIKKWLKSGRAYTVRFGTGCLMRHYLDDFFREECLRLVAGISHQDYYVKMMTAWYFATALAKRYDETLPYIEEKRLEPWTHNKAIQKAVESYRITDEQKKYLRTLKIN